MTISEANAVNIVLRHLYGPLYESEGRPSPESVVDASVLLANRASSTLMAGYDGHKVLERQTELTGVT